MTTLASLVSKLQSEVPAVNSVPTEAQYTQAVKDAAADFSRRCGLVQIDSIPVVSGQATYSLPDDFLKLIKLDALTGVDGVIIASGGLIPVAADWEETWTIENKQITFYPTPTYALTRYFKYKAAWVLDESEDYTTMGDDEAQIVMLKAKQIATEKISNSLASGGALKYSFGAVSVDKSGGGESLVKRLYAMQGEYVNACEEYNGAVMMAGGE